MKISLKKMESKKKTHFPHIITAAEEEETEKC